MHMVWIWQAKRLVILLEKNRSYVKIQKINWFCVKIRRIYAIPAIYSTKVKAKKGLLDMFPNGKWQNSTLMNSFLMIRKTFYIVRSCPQLWGVPKFIRTVNEKIEQLCRTPPTKCHNKVTKNVILKSVQNESLYSRICSHIPWESLGVFTPPPAQTLLVFVISVINYLVVPISP